MGGTSCEPATISSKTMALVAPSGARRPGADSGGEPQARHGAAWTQALELEKRLRAEQRKKSFWDVEVRRLRLGLQHAYEAVLFANYEFAQVRMDRHAG